MDENLIYEKIKELNRIVVKVGTSTLAYPTGLLNIRRIEELVKVISDLRNMGKEIIIVTSGAIGVGAGIMGMKERPRGKREKQAAAAVGQCELMNIYGRLFGQYGYVVAQILMTKDIAEETPKRENVHNTFEQLLCNGIIPIVNENDSISTEEAEFGDNDTLSAVVAQITDAGLLVILTDINGLYDSNPKENEDAKLIEVVDCIDDEVMAVAGGSGSKYGTGGMVTKLLAAKMAKIQGIYTIIADGHEPKNLYDIVEGKKVGTLFTTEGDDDE